MTTSLSRCHECAALLSDNGDDRRAHLSWHADTAKKIEAQRQRVGALSSDVLRLVDQIKDFRRTLDNHPITAEPAEITVNDIPENEIAEYEDDLEPDDGPTSTYADDNVAATLDLNDPIYPAIDRDDLDTRLAAATDLT